MVFRRRSQKAQAILDVLPSILGTADGKIAVENRKQDCIWGDTKTENTRLTLRRVLNTLAVPLNLRKSPPLCGVYQLLVLDADITGAATTRKGFTSPARKGWVIEEGNYRFAPAIGSLKITLARPSSSQPLLDLMV